MTCLSDDNAMKIYEKLSVLHNDAKCELEFKSPFELLVAVILSAQCTDKRVNLVTEKLFKNFNTAEQFAMLDIVDLKPYIYSCGFYNNKAENIIAMSKALVTHHNGNVPDDFDKLISLAGVGRKTASVVLSVAFNIPSVPVDTHVFRVSKRLGISKSKTVDGVEKDIKGTYAEQFWNPLHHFLIFHGRYICKSQKPFCDKCTLNDICNFYQVGELNE